MAAVRAKRDKPASVSRLMREAALFQLLAQTFAYPDAARRVAVAEAFGRIGSAGRWSGELRRRLLSAADAWNSAAIDDLQATYVRCFASDARCSLHESAYGDGRRIAGRPVELADIQGFYRAFGFQLRQENPDLPDHLCAELEFYSLLLVKEAYALASGWTEKAAIARTARRRFLEHHLGRWVGAVSGAIAADVPQPYAVFAELLNEAVARQVRHMRVAPKLADGRLPFDVMQADALACPMAADDGHEPRAG